MKLAMSWEIAALDAEFRAAVLHKEIDMAKREWNQLRRVMRTCRWFAARGDSWPS